MRLKIICDSGKSHNLKIEMLWKGYQSSDWHSDKSIRGLENNTT